MSSNPLRLKYLFKKYTGGECSPDELKEFWQLISEFSENDSIDDQMQDLWRQKNDPDSADPLNLPPVSDQGERLYENILNREKQQRTDYAALHQREGKTILRKLVAAASVAVFIGLGLWVFLRRGSVPESDSNAGDLLRTMPAGAISPGGDHAVLTYADGTVVILDSVFRDHPKSHGSLKLEKDGSGVLVLMEDEGNNEDEKVNRISTPTGGQYQFILPDGSRVFLNAESSVSFPSAFLKQRKITVTGEVYIQAAPDKSRPFFVNAGAMEIQVLGTAFNINSYANETSASTTLTEGKIKVRNRTYEAVLQPGQQLIIQGAKSMVREANLAEVTAWKDGYFIFNKTPIRSIMRQLARWYDLDVSYRDSGDELFSATFPRGSPVNDILSVLQLTGKIKFTVSGKTVVVGH